MHWSKNPKILKAIKHILTHPAAKYIEFCQCFTFSGESAGVAHGDYFGVWPLTNRTDIMFHTHPDDADEFFSLPDTHQFFDYKVLILGYKGAAMYVENIPESLLELCRKNRRKGLNKVNRRMKDLCI